MQVEPALGIRLRLLGPVDLAGPPADFARVVLVRPKLVALLSYLAAALPAGFHRRDSLVGMLWSEMDQDHARGALRQSLYHLRRFLGNGAIATRGEGVALAGDRVRCDVSLFQHALARGAREEALEVYRGDLLEGFHIAGAPMFERWLDQRRHDLQRQAHEAAWELAQGAYADGQVAAAAHWARRAFQLVPQDEAVLRRMIDLLDRMGDRAGAIREYEAFTKGLRDDLNIDPAPETRALVEDIRSRDVVATASRGSLSDSHPPRASIAVLPFLNLSPAANDEHLSDGFAEEITIALGRVEGLHVASRTSAFAFKGRLVNVRDVGKELGVATVLEGSVRKAEHRLRISAQLVQTSNGYQLWSDEFDRAAQDVFAIQAEIAQSIVRALEVLLADEDRPAILPPPTQNIEAYEYYLRGRHFLYRFQKHSVRHAREMFEQAIRIDPDYALAYAGVADCSSFLHTYFDASTANLTQAQETSRKALELAPDLAEAHAARGLAVSLDGGYPEAEREFQQAIALGPRSFESHYLYGRTCFRQGNFEQALRSFKKASELRDDYQARALTAVCLEALGRDAEARSACQDSLEAASKHLALYPGDARALSLAAGSLCYLGRVAEALDWCHRAVSIDPDDPAVVYGAACVDALAGRRVQALDGLERALALGLADKAWIWNDPDLASLHEEPRFRALVGD